MIHPRRIAAFYSHGPHYVRLLKRLRHEFPDAHLTAVVPPGFPASALAALVDATIETERARVGIRSPGVLLRLVRRLRSQRFDAFATMFASPKLRLLARASGAPARFVLGPDGQFERLRGIGLLALLASLWRRVRGTFRYLYIAYVIYRYPVEKP